MKKPRDNRKAKEKKIFERYLLNKKIPHLKVESPELDPPDLVLHIEDKLIYVEHTELMCRRGEEDRVREDSLKKLIRAVTERYDSKYPDLPISANFQFKYSVNIRGKKGTNLTISLVEKLHEFRPSDSETIEIHQYEGLPEEISLINLSALPKSMKSTIFFGEIQLYGSVKKDEFTARVENKNKRALDIEFSKRFDEAWLLLETGGKYASFADLDIPDDWLNPNWIFKRIILYNSFGGHKELEFIEIEL